VIILKDILYKVSLEKVVGNTAVAFRELQFDSREVGLDDVFIAIKGTQSNGHQYIAKAIHQGALAIICEQMPSSLINGITYIQVTDSQQALAIMAANFYENPSEQLQLVGVTGTNGKTTIATLLYNLFIAAGYEVGLLSTVKIMIGKRHYTATHTTPDSLNINSYLREMVDSGVEYCFMEVSSHGIHQREQKACILQEGFSLIYRMIT
jgi:UDP-N-acetylmuramoyl-L-alanyl-D-glutamate--2,6-diaminopimelate ligase